MAACMARCSEILSTTWRFSVRSPRSRCSKRSKSSSTLLWSCFRTISAFMVRSFPGLAAVTRVSANGCGLAERPVEEVQPPRHRLARGRGRQPAGQDLLDGGQRPLVAAGHVEVEPEARHL